MTFYILNDLGIQKHSLLFSHSLFPLPKKRQQCMPLVQSDQFLNQLCKVHDNMTIRTSYSMCIPRLVAIFTICMTSSKATVRCCKSIFGISVADFINRTTLEGTVLTLA